MGKNCAPIGYRHILTRKFSLIGYNDILTRSCAPMIIVIFWTETALLLVTVAF